MKIFLKLSYYGANYHGFQIQPSKPTVAGELLRATETLFGCKAKISGCSRTDAGVHALIYYACAELSRPYNSIPAEKIAFIYNHLLPCDISVLDAYPTEDDYNPRHAAVLKEYTYLIKDGGIKDPFLSQKVYFYPKTLDEELMDTASKHFIGTHDFKSFCATGSDVKTTVRTIESAKVFRENGLIKFKVCGNGFLYNMVRIMAGTLIYVSEGKIGCDDIPQIIKGQKRKDAGMTARADGLYLSNVILDKEYPHKDYNS